ncbi:MAG: HlyD family efflux transporter periplasmic adaptor subunit [Burkholderiales bacterium]|nr:HlyD family efflux transporter periplasmic adaptor subunit [Burkholderiales bacterium]
MPDLPETHASPDAASAVLRAQAALLSRGPLEEAATALAVELAGLLRCTRASVGILDGRLEVVATSQARDLDARMDAAAAIGAAMNESLDQSATLCFPGTDGGVPMVTLAHQVLAATGAACTVPVKGTDGVVGALTLERPEAFSAGEIALCEDVAGFAGPVLELKHQAQLAWWRRAMRGGRQWLGSRGNLGFKLGALATVALLAAAFTVPVSYRVSAPARLEGSVQRVIVAPADGFLQQANVRAGDAVREGQVLAEMASQDLQLEKRRRESELSQHENAYRTAQARNDRAQMVVSQSKAGEAQAMLSLADSQIDRARIQAPFDGVVIKGDLTQTLGAPVQRGEVLLTIAPNDSFRLIVEVDESDIGAIRPGQAGELALAAVPERALRFTTRRVVPVATSADTRNYFEVEAALEPQGASLRPGLSGVARIDAGERTTWWLLTHRLFNWLRLSVWSMGW